MAADRTERLLNLVLCLLGARQPVDRARIRSAVPGYAESASDDSFERMFERDKEELRGMGIPLETVENAQGEVLGYRIDSEAYALPEIPVTAEEVAVLGLAARAWTEGALGAAAQTAVRKIEALGPADAGPPTASVLAGPDLLGSPRPGDGELLVLWRAVREQRAVRFTYRARGRAAAEQRDVEPWGTVHDAGAWYLIGWDRAREAERAFRLSRIEGRVTVLPGPGHTVPARRDLPAPATRPAEAEAAGRARVEIARGHGARRSRAAHEDGARVGESDDGTGPRDDAEVVVIDVVDERLLASDVAALGRHARVLEPPELAAAVVARLVAARDAHAEHP
ncbi:MAG: helix-turn-helix transcriptional regulator [bacterium]